MDVAKATMGPATGKHGVVLRHEEDPMRTPKRNENDALVKRINRQLRERRHRVRIARPGEVAKLGAFYVEDTARARIVRTNVDVVSLARELGVMTGEEVARG